jgi:hypothetical protein
MVQYRGITRGMRLNDVADELSRDIVDLKRDVLTSTAEVIAQTSPVDTGTYARSHRVGLRSGSFKASVSIPDGAPRNVSPGPPRSEGLSEMMAGIASVDLTSDNIVFRNISTHARYVEARDMVYAAARREIGSIIQDALMRARSR